MTMPSSAVSRFRDAPEFFRFLVVGGSGALAFVGLSTLAREVSGLSVPVVSIGCHAILIPIMFRAQRSFTFESRGGYRGEFLKYAVLQITCISFSSMLYDFVGGDVSGDRVFHACVFAAISATSAILSFAVCRFAIFSQRPARPLSSS